MYVLAENLTEGVSGIEVSNLTENQTGCLHDYQLTSRDMKLLSRADVFLVNGAGMELFMENGIICDNLHAPYLNINHMWGEDVVAGEAMLGQLLDSVDKCHRYGIPRTIVHLSSGRPMPAITEIGLRRTLTKKDRVS